MKNITGLKPNCNQVYLGVTPLKPLVVMALVGLSFWGNGSSAQNIDDSTNFLAPLSDTENVSLTGFAANLDPNNIGDTLTGTNHITYSSTDSGNATGSVEFNNPDGSAQTIYYTYTMPEDYSETSNWIGHGSVNKDAIQNKLFINSHHESQNQGGAVWITWASGEGDIISDFIENGTTGTNDVNGGAVMNHFSSSRLQNITGDFIGNSSIGRFDAGCAGAVVNAHDINSITGDFIGNYATYSGDEDSYGWGSIGGAIWSLNNITSINGNFIGNYASAPNYTYGGAIQGSKIDNLTGNFIGNYAQSTFGGAYGGAINGGVTNLSGNFIGNSARSYSDNCLALGGAIHLEKDMNIIANGQESIFSGNYTQDYRGKLENAIFIANTDITLQLNAKNNGGITFDDQIDGGTINTVVLEGGNNREIVERNYQYTLKLTGDETGKINFNNDIFNANIVLENVTTNVSDGKSLNHELGSGINSLTMNSGTLNINSLDTSGIHFKEFNLNGGVINLNNVKVDLLQEKMGSISAGTYGDNPNGKINVNSLSLLNDATKDNTKILFADEGLANNIDTTVKTVSYSPIYKYDVNYLIDDDNKGYFTFARSSNGGSSTYNPAVITSSVASQAGATATMNQTFNYAFQNADNFMNIPYLERIAIKNANKYALSPTGDATDVGTFSPLFTQNDTSSVWVKPYASFENIPLKNGPKVSNITYGTLVGFDTQLTQMKHGWDRVWTGYIGYNGASQRYSGVNSTQNGGLLGGTLTLYKGNFFNATTISAGASVAENTNMYGHENFSMLLAGIGNKAGYNFEFKEGKIIIQPSLLMSYTFVNTFDYTNAAGVRIKSDPLHSIQLSPGVKFIGNTKNGWQPYIGVNMVWNILDKSNVHANDVKLPEMSIKPYVQYGVGVQKRFKDKCMAFGQAMIQNGGRNGISLTAGFRWSLGKEGKAIKDNEKVMIPDTSETIFNDRRNAHVNRVLDSQPKRTVLKQLTPEQKVSLGAKPQNTTRTTSRAILKQL